MPLCRYPNLLSDIRARCRLSLCPASRHVMRCAAVLVCLWCLAGCTGGSGVPEAVSLGVQERGFTTERLQARDIVEESHRYRASAPQRSHGSAVLAYLTPWNGGGAEAAVRHAAKLTHVAPCWHAVRFESGALVVTPLAEAEAAQAWSTRVRAANSALHLVPRLALELDGPGVHAVLQRPGMLADAVAQLCAKHGYDGAVLDGLAAWLSAGLPLAQLTAVIAPLSRSLRGDGRQLLLAIPATFTATALTALAPDVDYFSLMSYDASVHAGRAGPNAPLPWVQASLASLFSAQADGVVVDPDSLHTPSIRQTKQVLLGLNFYGWSFAAGRQAEARLGHDIVAAMKQHAPRLHWDADAAEHWFELEEGSTKQTVWYPTPASVKSRVELARRTGTGIAIWELGQGQEWFYDLL